VDRETVYGEEEIKKEIDARYKVWVIP